ncbi:hypothetical protein JOE48_000133 [Methylobacterium sp. PvR107]|nr:hypothetical protein [Methylobacterium sp. PvR107]
MTILSKTINDETCDVASINKVRVHIRKVLLDAIGQSNQKQIEALVLDLCS